MTTTQGQRVSRKAATQRTLLPVGRVILSSFILVLPGGPLAQVQTRHHRIGAHLRISSAAQSAALRTAAPQLTISADNPLPNVASLLVEVQKNQRAIDEILENYTYTKLEEETELDSRGHIKNKHVQEYVVFYVNGREVQKLAARDGRSLSSADEQKEQGRVRKQVQRYASTGPKVVGSSRRDEEEEDELHISVFLRAARFTNPRREALRGQQVIALDIEPNPGYHAQNLNERLVQKLEGTMWIDERAHQVVRLQANLSSTAKIAGGLLGSIGQGSAAVFEQALVNNEVWLPLYLEEHLSGRALLFKNYRRDFVIHYKEYKKFRVETHNESEAPTPN